MDKSLRATTPRRLPVEPDALDFDGVTTFGRDDENQEHDHVSHGDEVQDSGGIRVVMSAGSGRGGARRSPQHRRERTERQWIGADVELVVPDGSPLSLVGRSSRATFMKYSFDQWKSKGLDTHSVIADPQFVDARGRGFRRRPGSPAPGLGFRPIDLGTVGPGK
jgi:hypothetical protein